MQVLDALLAESARYFDVKSRRLAVVADSVSDNITRSLNSKNTETAGELQRLLPVQKYVYTSTYTDVLHTCVGCGVDS